MSIFLILCPHHEENFPTYHPLQFMRVWYHHARYLDGHLKLLLKKNFSHHIHTIRSVMDLTIWTKQIARRNLICVGTCAMLPQPSGIMAKEPDMMSPHVGRMRGNHIIYFSLTKWHVGPVPHSSPYVVCLHFGLLLYQYIEQENSRKFSLHWWKRS